MEFKQLAFHRWHDVLPIWTPDAKAIYFISQRSSNIGSYNAWKMELNNICKHWKEFHHPIKLSPKAI